MPFLQPNQQLQSTEGIPRKPIISKSTEPIFAKFSRLVELWLYRWSVWNRFFDPSKDVQFLRQTHCLFTPNCRPIEGSGRSKHRASDTPTCNNSFNFRRNITTDGAAGYGGGHMKNSGKIAHFINAVIITRRRILYQLTAANGGPGSPPLSCREIFWKCNKKTGNEINNTIN